MRHYVKIVARITTVLAYHAGLLDPYGRPSAGLPGPSREITVEPQTIPDVAPATEPVPGADPMPEPTPTPEREPEKVPA